MTTMSNAKGFAARVATVLLAVTTSTAGPAWSADPVAPPSVQPSNERAAQKILPRVRDEMWTKLAECTVDEDPKKGIYSIKLTPEVRALDGKKITMRGFVLPLDGSDQTKHFLITRNTPVCLYCAPGEANEVVEVRAERAVAWTNKVVSVTGRFKLIDDKEKALFFRIENATAK